MKSIKAESIVSLNLNKSMNKSSAQVDLKHKNEFKQRALKQLRLEMGNIEEYCRQSSDDITENIQSLEICIHNNSSGLQRALTELNNLSKKQFGETTTPRGVTEISSCANKILSQFENFSSYC